jgi:hypothetical protein
LRRLLFGALCAWALAAGPALATSIPAVASGEAPDREAAVDKALRRAVEQVVGVSITSSTYVQNLRQIEDRILATASGYVEGYDIVDEEVLPGGGYRVTVSARVSKEKLTTAITPIVGGAVVSLNRRVSLANLSVALENQKATERALRALVDELGGPAMTFAFKPVVEVGTTQPEALRVRLTGFDATLDPSWYRRYRGMHRQIAETPYAQEVFSHLQGYTSYGQVVVDLLNQAGETLETHRLENLERESLRELLQPGTLPATAPSPCAGRAPGFTVGPRVLELVRALRVRVSWSGSDAKRREWPGVIE